jgi:hypothetical protein
MFEIVEMYIFQIHLHYFFLACCMLKQNRDLFYFLIWSLSDGSMYVRLSERSAILYK